MDAPLGGNIILRGCKGGADLKNAGGSIEVENDGARPCENRLAVLIRCHLQEASENQSLLLDLETTGGRH